jgi:hypothetical protein
MGCSGSVLACNLAGVPEDGQRRLSGKKLTSPTEYLRLKTLREGLVNTGASQGALPSDTLPIATIP